VVYEDLQIYSIEIVHKFEWGYFTQPYLSIKGLGQETRNKKLYKKIDIDEIDSSSDGSIDM